MDHGSHWYIVPPVWTHLSDCICECTKKRIGIQDFRYGRPCDCRREAYFPDCGCGQSDSRCIAGTDAKRVYHGSDVYHRRYPDSGCHQPVYESDKCPQIRQARRYGKVGFGFWVFPSVVLLIGLYVIIKPMAPANMAMLILGWCSLLYGVTELVNSLKFHADKRKYKQAQEVPVAEEIIEEPASVEAIKEEGPSDNTQLSVPTSSDTL